MRKLLWAFLIFAAILALAAAVLIPLGWSAFGQGAKGERLAKMKASPQYKDGKFRNERELYNNVLGSLTGFINKSKQASPKAELPVIKRAKADFVSPQDLRLTWLGHSTVLIEIEGKRFLTDPVWGERTSPFSFMGPKRWYKAPLALADLPPIDAILISHDHYDHLDEPTIRKLASIDTKWIAPLGVGAHLEYWGIPAERLTEVDWGDRLEVEGITIESTRARHASGRHALDQNATLWTGYAVLGQQRRVYFSGDTGMFPEFADIGERLGPFDIVMIEVGAYDQNWPDWHIGPEQAVRAHQMLKGEIFVPIHWGLFDLAMHSWTEPVERVAAAAKEAGVRVQTPKPGESITTETATIAKWWPGDVTWRTADEYPIVSTKLD